MMNRKKEEEKEHQWLENENRRRHVCWNLPEIVARVYGIPRFVPRVSGYLAEALEKSLRRRRRVKDIVRHQRGAVHDGEDDTAGRKKFRSWRLF